MTILLADKVDRHAAPPPLEDGTPETGRSEPPSIVLIDRRELTRHCLSLWLKGIWRGCRITSVSTPDELIGASQSFSDAHLIVFSTGATRVMEIVADIDRMSQSLPHVPLVLLSDGEDIDDILEAIDRGVRGYITTTLEESDAAEAIRFVRSGGTFVPASALVRSVRHRQATPDRGSQGLDKHQGESLTRREMEVLALLRRGKPNKVIAHELDISASTVKVFVRQILLKLHANNRTEVAYLTRKEFDEIKSDSSG